MGQMIAIANQKGGVGKTTTAVNLAACLAAAGHRTLLVDLDPQGNATQGVGVDKNDLHATLYDVLINDVAMAEIILPTTLENLYVAPTNRELVGAEVELVQVEGRERRLQRSLEAVQRNYKYVIIDCPPSLSLLTVNGLVAATHVLITLQCEYYALEGLSELWQTVARIRELYNPKLRLKGVALTMYQHTNLSKQVVDDVRAHLEDDVMNTVIPRNVSLSEAPSHGKTIIQYDLRCAGAQAYIALAQEVIARG